MEISDKDKARFLSKVSTAPHPKGCHIWLGAADKYGNIGIGGKTLGAHRVSWVIHIGPIPDGLDICHECDNPICVNPDHLFAGTVSDNMLDCSRKGRHKPARLIGEKNHKAVLSESDITPLRIRRMAGESVKKLAAEFGISESAMSSALTGKTWKHIPMPQ